jgi:hypothetical protein
MLIGEALHRAVGRPACRRPTNLAHALRLLNDAFARGAISETDYETGTPVYEPVRPEIKAWREGKGDGSGARKSQYTGAGTEPETFGAPENVSPANKFEPAQPRLALRRATPLENNRRQLVLRRRVAASGMPPHQLAGESRSASRR